ncbi:recombinase family protein [Acetobacter persici]|uniref:recombinase family protein n=1 Tax=Acetobacter persici TaxID=1076596 RepID=UPI0020CFD8F6|nr:recombinase family protein [Acetobacter persici]MCP9319151.1 recombinase family protein [Acetobacter persici]
MKNYGYVRVSTEEQNFDSQIQELLKNGIQADDIVCEKISGSVFAKNRPYFSEVMDKLHCGDTLTVVKLDRLGRNAIDVLSLIDELHAQEIGVKILNLGVDTQKASGRLFLTLLAGFAEFERDIIRERCRAGLESARAKGVLLGRRCSLTKRQREHARDLKAQGMSSREVAKVLNTSKMTAWRAMNSVS